MEREVMFRGWNFEEKKWVYGYHSRSQTGMHTIDVYKPSRYCECNFVIPASIGQGTACALNGVEIYEGDLISIDPETEEPFYEVVWHEGGFQLKLINPDHMGMMWGRLYRLFDADMKSLKSKAKIVANKFENPELL